MSARALVVYAVSDPQGGATYPTKAAALAAARDAVRERPDDAENIHVDRVTIPGPFNRDLVCRLLSSGGYASEVVTIWHGARS